MNIFFLDIDPEICAKYHVDKHVVKMIIELAQLLCTAHHIIGSDNEDFKIPYKKTHVNHPSAIWVRQGLYNYVWTVNLGLELCKEYTYRYEKVHKTEQYLQMLYENYPKFTPDLIIATKPLLAITNKECKIGNAIKSYREYYIREKSHLHSWKKRDVPEWILNDSRYLK